VYYSVTERVCRATKRLFGRKYLFKWSVPGAS